jgi:hypothetical protein
MKRKVFVNTGEWGIENLLQGKIGTVINNLKALELKLEDEGYENLKLKFIQSYTAAEFELWGYRLETDEELELRRKMEQIEIDKVKKKLERERAKYEELKKKFEDV